MKKYYTIKVWPKDPHEESMEFNKYESIEAAKADVKNIHHMFNGGQWMVTVRYGNPKSLADNYLNMRKAMRNA